MPDEAIATTNNGAPKIEAPKPIEVMHLIAKNPRQMAKSQRTLLEWLTNKVAFEKREVEDVQEALNIAAEKGWELAALERQVLRATGRVRYYEKLLAAVDEGYCIVPNFPVDFFAIRTRNKMPRTQFKEIRDASNWQDPAVNFDDVPGGNLPIGEGRYVSPEPEVERGEQTVVATEGAQKGKEILVKEAWTTDFMEVAFPLIAARPEIMDATAIAMAHKFFDAIGICPPGTRRRKKPPRQPDPLIIGKIFGGGGRWHRSEASFLITWHLDLRML
jgi:hypothetical protein